MQDTVIDFPGDPAGLRDSLDCSEDVPGDDRCYQKSYTCLITVYVPLGCHYRAAGFGAAGNESISSSRTTESFPDTCYSSLVIDRSNTSFGDIIALRLWLLCNPAL